MKFDEIGILDSNMEDFSLKSRRERLFGKLINKNPRKYRYAIMN
jgi:hypothetical protein